MNRILLIMYAVAMVLNANAQDGCGPGTYWDPSVSLCLPANNCPADLNNNGAVGTADLLIFLSAYSNVCPLIEGCTDVSACNFNPEAVSDNESCLYGEYIFEGCFCWYTCGDEWTDGTGGCGWIEISGCTDSEACNYDENICEEDGSCIYPIDVWGADYVNCEGDCLNDVDNDGICDELEIWGCTIDTADNYDSLASEDDGSCQIPGCIVAVACNYDPEATVDDGTCFFYCPGCTDPEACNYDAEAIQENGTCTFPIDVFGIDYVDCEGGCLNDEDGDGICTEDEIMGCTDETACNYNQVATDNDGTCEYETCAGCMDEIACNYDLAATIENEADCDYESCAGCLYEFACNYNPLAEIAANELCEFGTCPGCTDDNACNYNPTIIEDDGSCEYPAEPYLLCDGSCISDLDQDGVCDEVEIFGCTGWNACNFQVMATEDDGSCEYLSCQGCMDEQACNFDPSASVNDGSCTYPEPSLNCDGTCINDANGDGLCDCSGTDGTIFFDDKYYQVVEIDGRCWFAENLESTHYANGDMISDNVCGGGGWYAIGDVGNLYNFYAAIDDRGLCPSGWNVASNSDFFHLANALGGFDVAGIAMKSSPLDTPSWNGTNSSGFSGVIGGAIGGNPCGQGAGGCFFHTRSSYSSTGSWVYQLNTDWDHVYRFPGFKVASYSVRCIRD